MKTNVPARPSLRRALGAAALAVLLGAPASAQTLVETFDGAAIDSATWYARKTSGTIAVSGGLASLTVGALTTSQRALLVSQDSFNPFDAPVTVTFDNLTLNGSPSTGQPTWGNTFYAALGRANADAGTLNDTIAANYSAVGNSYLSALGLNVRRSDTAVTLSLIDRGSTTHTTANFTLSGVPTDIVWTVEGDADGVGGSWSVSLTGATFVVGETTPSSMSGTFLKFNEAELLNSGTPVSRLAFGAVNVGTVVTATGISLDSVSVGAIPEPASFALLVSGFVGAAAISRRRRPRAGA